MTNNEVIYGLVGLAVGAILARRYYQAKLDSLAELSVQTLAGLKEYYAPENPTNKKRFQLYNRDNLRRLQDFLEETQIGPMNAREKGGSIRRWANDFEGELTLEDKTK